MKKFLLLCILLTGCVAVPVQQKFPEVPQSLKEACPQLELVPTDTTKLSSVLSVVVSNYALYHECQAKVDTWNEWYNNQKKIYEK